MAEKHGPVEKAIWARLNSNEPILTCPATASFFLMLANHIDKLEAGLAEHRDTIERCASEHRANDMHDSGYY